MCFRVGKKMRAFYIKHLQDFSEGQEVSIDDETFQHIKVVRLKPNEVVKFLDGAGHHSHAKLISLEKKKAIFKITDFAKTLELPTWDLAIGLVKKDAFDLCLKMATELGVGRIYPLLTSFSQRYELNHDRAQRLLIQALEQSNSKWLPEIQDSIELKDFCQQYVDNNDKYSNYLCMGMSSSVLPSSLEAFNGKSLGFIGPEGGFSEEEEHQIGLIPNCRSIHLPTPILRAPTAIASLAGVIFTKQNLLD